MAGVAGFEPANDGIKTRCLAAWRHPNLNCYPKTPDVTLSLPSDLQALYIEEIG